MEIRNDFLRTLADTGNLATFFGLHDNAQAIFEGICVVRPNNHHASIGLAFSKIYARRLNEAIAILWDSVLKAEPGNLSAKCYLGMALKYTGQNCEGDRLLQEVIETVGNDHVNERTMARELLESHGLGMPA